MTNQIGFGNDRALSQFTYENDEDGKRVSRTTSRPPGEFTDGFVYDNDTGGLASSDRNSPAADAPRYAYFYDKIGNRQSASDGLSETTYDSNALNQYVRIAGDRSSNPSHDVDGNLTSKGDRSYRWDGENRLTEIRERGTLVARYAYDYKSRRIARWNRDGIDERYLYQGWNLIAVYSPDENEPTQTFTWGKDLSGTFQGAGGVGGLLFAKNREHGIGNDAWIYHYDANGNVTELTDSKGTLLDRYQYDPFGNLVVTPQLPENPFRFSTKHQDAESGFYYYGHRYYDSTDGRWLSRDPIGEKGGLMLYGFVGNDVLNQIDRLGLSYAHLAYYAIRIGIAGYAAVGIWNSENREWKDILGISDSGKIQTTSANADSKKESSSAHEPCPSSSGDRNYGG